MASGDKDCCAQIACPAMGLHGTSCVSPKNHPAFNAGIVISESCTEMSGFLDSSYIQKKHSLLLYQMNYKK